jgi:excisionase family DNA binding protein
LTIPNPTEIKVETRKRTIITSETHEVLIVRRPHASAIPLWCSDCAEQVEMLTPEEAAAVANVSTRKIYAWIESQRIHHLELPTEDVLICMRQLLLRRTELTTINNIQEKEK